MYIYIIIYVILFSCEVTHYMHPSITLLLSKIWQVGTFFTISLMTSKVATERAHFIIN